MKIYESTVPLGEDRNFAFVRMTFANDLDRKRFGMADQFRGLPLPADSMQPYHLKRSDDYPGSEAVPLGDRLVIGYHRDPMALSCHALDILLPHIGPTVQVVPVEFNEGDYALLNVVNVIDALDSEQSEIAYFKSGNFDRIRRYAFHPEAVRDQWIFKIKQTQSRAFVTQRFIDLVQQEGLTGFDFEEVWSDEATSEATAEGAVR